MQINEASKILRDMYQKADAKEKALSIHLFGIKYAHHIENMSAKDIIIGAELPESYKTELRKGINLAKYVEVKS